jgi:hypothetical protein
MPLTNHAWDAYVAPGMSLFTKADIPDMSEHDPQTKLWLQTYIMSGVLQGEFDKTTSTRYVFNFLRRAEAAFGYHEQAREETARYLSSPRSASAYMRALLAWEGYLSQSWPAFELMRRFLGAGKFFTSGDRSPPERLHHMYNRAKHAETAIAAGQLTEDGRIPVWMTNEGLASVDCVVTWEETAGFLRVLATFAGAVQQPSLAKQRLFALMKELGIPGVPETPEG